MKFSLNFLNIIFFASQGTWQPEEHPKGSLNLIDQVEKEKERGRKRKELKTKKSVGAQTLTNQRGRRCNKKGKGGFGGVRGGEDRGQAADEGKGAPSQVDLEGGGHLGTCQGPGRLREPDRHI